MSEKARRRLEVSLTAVFITSVSLVAALLIFSGGSATAKQIATLRILGGQVEIAHDGGDARSGEDGESLREGDIVRTGPDGRASIEYFDGSVTRLDFETTLELVALELLDDDTGSKVIEGSQLDGNSYHRVAELPDASSRFVIQTPTATASVQGTVYVVMVNDDGSTTIATLEGLVKTHATGGAVDVPAGKMVVVGTNGVAGLVVEISDELLDSDWFTFNQCDLDQVRDCAPPSEVEPEEPKEGSTDEPKDQPEGSDAPKPASSPQGPGGQHDGPPGIGGPGDGPPPGGQNRSPNAGFVASPEMGTAPLTVGFTDASSDPDGDALTRSWTFGDGASENGGLTPTHTYHQPGHYVVTLLVTDPDGATDTRRRGIDVIAANGDPEFDHILISPSNSTIDLGQSQNYTAEAFDTAGNSMGNVTGQTTFQIQPSGSCNGNTCTPTDAGTHTVTGTFSGDGDSASLVVRDPPPPPCPNYGLSFRQRPPDTRRSGQPFNVQIDVQVQAGGDPNGPLTISLGGAPFTDGETSLSWTGQGTVVFNGLRIDAPGTYGVFATANCATPTGAASVTVTDDPNANRGLAIGLVTLPATLGGLLRRRRYRRVGGPADA